MRKTADRIRHAISFELIGLGIIVPLGALIFGEPVADMGVISLFGATIATAWNYGYNLLFDIGLNRLTGSTLKTLPARLIHAVAFEAGLLALMLPIIAWYLRIGVWEALVMDLSFAGFYLVYGFVFNYAYDRIFPLPEWSEPRQSVS